MSNPTPLPKDTLSIGELKNRIAHYERKLKADSTDELYAERRYDALALAWRAAFEWHVGLLKRHADLSDQLGAHLTDWIAIDREEEEGLALIREKLQS
jgi:hypothetical protein